MKLRWIGAALAAFFMLPMFGVVAYAGGGDSLPPQVIDITPRTESTPAPVTDNAKNIPVRESPDTAVQPLTPAGTGTVIDHATDSDEKEFYTIMTPDENVFYLVIDRQREAENVYFLNAVTEEDLLSLAKKPQPAPVVAQQPPVPPESEPEPAPQKSGSGMLLVVAVVILIGGGAGWYFKLYRPKQQQADNAEEFESEDDYDLYGESDTELDYDTTDWDSPEPDGDSE